VTSGYSNDNNKRPGLVLQQVLSEMPPAERLPFLAWAEQSFRQAKDLEALRELQAYRALQPSTPKEPSA